MKRLPAVLFLTTTMAFASGSDFALRHRAVRPMPVGMSAVEHVMVVVLENQDLSVSMQQPFLAALSKRGALLTQYRDIGHPSQPNYIAMVAGDTLGVTDDLTVTLDATHLADLLEANGDSWKVYAESYPGHCDLHGGIKGADGDYVRRHVGFINFKNVQSDPRRCARIVNATELDSDIAAHSLPRFSFYIPNDNDNGHDTNIATADAFMQHRFGPLLQDPRFTTGTLLIVTFDEGAFREVVYTAFIGAGIQPAVVNANSYNHYDLLRTIEEIFHLGTLGRKDATARVIDGIWTK